ncbi:MAG TPA: hypothetical protein VG271_14830 [Beijerinckiaceae bacterium]|jgi:leader peptidase (prepilin peptidase)/N-methyltransferase|nr:hypothetical protein [Beijerinckiaceae bacterium]
MSSLLASSAWLSWTLIPVAVDMAAVTALGVYFLPRQPFSADIDAPTKLPFGLFFAPAIWLCWLLQQLYPAYSPF